MIIENRKWSLVDWKYLVRKKSLLFSQLIFINIIKGTKSSTIESVNEFDNDTYAIVQYELTLRRRSRFYVFNLVFPALILSILNLVGFILPAKSGEKIVLEISVFLAIIFFQSYISNIVPNSSTGIPKICN